MTYPYTRREKAFFYACLYLGVLFLSTCTMWWTVLVGGNPFDVRNIGVTDSAGATKEIFRTGETVGITRRICSSKSVPAQYFPSLYDINGYWYPLQAGIITVNDGCVDFTHAFILPDLPPGEYTYASTIRFQNNLIGRDEMETFPALSLRVVR